MSDRSVIQIHPEAASKPDVGAPCNGCGVCCAAEPCPVGMLVSRRRTGSCDALVWTDAEGRYRCGVVTRPEAYVPGWLAPLAGRLAGRLIAAGAGCDCSFSVETA